MAPEVVRERVRRIQEAGPSSPRVAREPVNQAMIDNWVEAIGDDNPIYIDEDAARAAGHDGIVAPPAMLQAWTLHGLHEHEPPDDPFGNVLDLMREAGYPAIVSTNCEQTYHRYLRLGERLAMVTTLADVRGPKQTSLGNGWFLRSHYEWFVGDELVAEQDFTSLAYVPPPTRAPRPSRAPDPVPAIDEISPLVIETTPTFIIATAIATRDFYPVHHDRDRAQRDGAKDIFVNILTDTALVGRVVTDWAGPSARLRSIALQLNTPCYAYDTLTLSAGVVNVDGRWTTLTVDGECGAGNHVTATVVIER